MLSRLTISVDDRMDRRISFLSYASHTRIEVPVQLKPNRALCSCLAPPGYSGARLNRKTREQSLAGPCKVSNGLESVSGLLIQTQSKSFENGSASVQD